MEELITASMFPHMWRVVVMLVFAPPYLAAILALLINAFRTRTIAVAALVIAFLLSLRMSFAGKTIGVVEVATPMPALFGILVVVWRGTTST